MSRETKSEKLVKISNKKYSEQKKANVNKIDPGIRITGKQLLFASSRGLDYSGSLYPDGKHIEFEVKETERENLPFSNIRMSQLDQMQSLIETGAESFLLVWFSNQNEWYRLNLDKIQKLVEKGYKSISLKFFRAFGYLIPRNVESRCPEGWPDYLNPEHHPDSNFLKNNFKSWMKDPPAKKEIVRIESPDHQDQDARRERILNAIIKGTKNAEKRNIQTNIFRQMAIMKKKYGDEI